MPRVTNAAMSITGAGFQRDTFGASSALSQNAIVRHTTHILGEMAVVASGTGLVRYSLTLLDTGTASGADRIDLTVKWFARRFVNEVPGMTRVAVGPIDTLRLRHTLRACGFVASVWDASTGPLGDITPRPTRQAIPVRRPQRLRHARTARRGGVRR